METSDGKRPRTSRAPRFVILGGVGLMLAGILAVDLAEILLGWRAELILLGPRLVLAGALLGTIGVLAWLLEPGRRRETDLQGEFWLCPNCFAAYVPDAHFCPECGAPVDEFAARNQYERAYAQAWILGKAARAPRRLLHVIGIGLVTAPAFLFLISVFWEGATWGFDGLVGFGIGALFAAPYVALLVLAVRNWRNDRAETDYGTPPWWTFDREWSAPESPEPEGSA